MIAPGDYISMDELLTFEPGVTTRQVPISITEDNVDEELEIFFANLSLESVAGNDDVTVVPSIAGVDIIDVARTCKSSSRYLVCLHFRYISVATIYPATCISNLTSLS